jgi:hypothetical protein
MSLDVYLCNLRQELQLEDSEKLKIVERPKMANFSLLGKPVETVGASEREPIAFQPPTFS